RAAPFPTRHGRAWQGPRRDPGRIAGGRVVAGRLSLLAPLRVRRRRVQDRRPAADPPGRRQPDRLHPGRGRDLVNGKGPLIEVDDLHVTYKTTGEDVLAVRGLN